MSTSLTDSLRSRAADRHRSQLESSRNENHRCEALDTGPDSGLDRGFLRSTLRGVFRFAAAGLALALFGAAPALANAVFDEDLGAPACLGSTNACDSRDLLERSGHMLPPELNHPNTYEHDQCHDGDDNAHHLADESIERIVVRNLSAPELIAGDMVQINVTFFPYGNGFDDVLEIYYSDDAQSTETIQTENKLLFRYFPAQSGLQTFSRFFTVPTTGSLQHRIRARLSYKSQTSRCDGNGFYDVDELIFAVAPPNRLPVVHSDGDGVPDEDEYAFCEGDDAPNCGQLSHQMRLAKLLIFNEELTEAEFDDHKEDYEYQDGVLGPLTETEYCNAIAVPNMVAAAEESGLHPPTLSAVRSQVCRWQPRYTSDRSLAEQDADHCRLSQDASDADKLFMAQAEKAINSESGGLCKAFNFLKTAAGMIDGKIGPEYNFRFKSLLETAVLSDVFSPATADSLRVILGAMFPEQMCELGPAENPALFLRQQIQNLALDYLDEQITNQLRGAHWSEDRQNEINPGFGLTVPASYSKRDKLRDDAWACEVSANTRATDLFPGVDRWSRTARASLRMIFYDLCITPALQSAVKFSDSEDRPALQELLDSKKDRIRSNVETLNNETDPADDLPDWTVDMNSYLAPFNLLFDSDSIKPGFLDFNSGEVLPTVLEFPTMYCDAPKPYSELLEMAESTEAAMRSDCVSVEHDGTAFELYEDQCSREVRILCDVSSMNATEIAITDYFVTEQKYPLAEANNACIAEGELDLTNTTITTAYAASDINGAADGAIQKLSDLDPGEAYGTGFVVCNDGEANATVLENKGLDYVQCAGGAMTRSAYKRANELPQSLQDNVQRRVKRPRSVGGNPAREGAIVEFRRKLIEEMKASAGRNRLNHYTLPVGQGSCHIVQCIETPPADASGNVGPLTINSVVYDCGTHSQIYLDESPTQQADTDYSNFIRFITEHLDSTGNRLLARTLLYELGESTTDHVIVSHTDADHNNMLMELWPSPAQIPKNWTLGGRPEDFKREPLWVMIDRLEAGYSVTVNGHEITNADITKAGDTSMDPDGLRHAKINRLREGDMSIDPMPNGVENLVPDALRACGNATMHLQTINEDILEQNVPDQGQALRLNSVSAVVTLEVPDRFLAVLPGDAVRSTWVSAQNNAAANNTALTAARRQTFPIRYLASAHHGSFHHGSNDTLVNDFIQPTHVVFSHAEPFRHVHDMAWYAYWNSVVRNDNMTATLKIKDSRHGDSPVVPTPVPWTDDTGNGGGWAYKAALTDVNKRALVSTYTNGLIVGSLLFPKAGSSNVDELKTTFTLRRFSLDPANMAHDFLLGNALFRQDVNPN